MQWNSSVLSIELQFNRKTQRQGSWLLCVCQKLILQTYITRIQCIQYMNYYALHSVAKRLTTIFGLHVFQSTK